MRCEMECHVLKKVDTFLLLLGCSNVCKLRRSFPHLNSFFFFFASFFFYFPHLNVSPF
jgi:hypothetical protein